MSIDDAFLKVKEFHKKFEHPVSEKPRALLQDRKEARAEWMREEINEFLEAGHIVDQADAMIDLIYFALGTMVEMGVKPAALLDIVQQANMSKLHNGKPVFREDGKVVKPEGWQPPEPMLKKEVDRQKSE
jgi:predicted HAD superfamily Cof-like phosphohydrolase